MFMLDLQSISAHAIFKTNSASQILENSIEQCHFNCESISMIYKNDSKLAIGEEWGTSHIASVRNGAN